MRDFKDIKVAVAGTGYVGLSIATLLSQHHHVTAVDVLPELFNIINGDMSVIGPRPLPPTYNDYYKKEEMDRFKVRGGLVTPDSVDPNPIISWDKQFEYEADYGRNLSLKKDIQIFIGVFHILFKRTETDYGEFVRKALNVERANLNKQN